MTNITPSQRPFMLGSQGRIFPGWYVVGFAFVMQFLVMGLVYYSFGVYLKPLAEALEVTRFEISLTLSIEAITVSLIAPKVSQLFSSHSIKTMLLIGISFMSVGFIAMSMISSLWQLYFVYGVIIAIGLVSLTAIPSNLLIANWFSRRRGIALGISQFGISFSAAVLVPMVTWLMLTYGWRAAFAISGIFAFLILAPLIILLAVKSPEEVGRRPDGESNENGENHHVGEPQLWTFRKAIVTRDIWLITLIVGPCNFAIASVLLSLPAHATDQGITPMGASSIVATTAVFGASAKIIFGALADKLPLKLLVGIVIFLQASGVVLLIDSPSYLGMMVAGGVFGAGYGAIATLWAVLLAHQFGRSSFPTIIGANMPMTTPFTLAALPFTNWVFETQGSYRLAFFALLGWYVVALVSLFVLKLRPREDSQYG